MGLLKWVEDREDKVMEVVVVQEPTMLRRTVAGFEKAFEGIEGWKFIGWATFIPEVEEVKGEQGAGSICFKTPKLTDDEAGSIWEIGRFVDLCLGEIPRLRDDQHGYGPKGKGFIVHVDIPEEVEEGWKVVKAILGMEGGRVNAGVRQ
ncbi:hypothetical protein HDV00_004439 [Rhizophlyctis rosea]|nr:hypothetical protein HDV00_004439 [Rhizophlyctis rosea]